jgi:ubiquinone/menaquinone biosynthesis C-methylase UbiE
MTPQHFDGRFGASAPENYERFFVPAIGRPVAVELVRAADLRPGERVLDAGCGTRVVARLAAREVGPDGAVVGVDVNEGMLEVASTASPPEAGIEWHEANVEDLPLSDESFDVVLCGLSFQFVGDRPRALREMRRVLVPGGRLALNVPGPIVPMFALLADALARNVDAQAGGFARAVFALHDEEELRALLERAGFREVEIRSRAQEFPLPAPRDFLWQYVESTPIAALMAGAGEDVRASLEEDVVARWSAFAEGAGMRYSQPVVVATGRR